MSEFKKPTQIKVSINQAVKQLLSHSLIKDLCDNEAICPVCGGTGLEIADNRYGIVGDPSENTILFPYKRMTITFCHNCYNGIVRICPDCGKQIPRGSMRCTCEAEQQRQKEEKFKAYLEKLRHATHHSPSALGSDFEYAYSEEYGYNDGYFDDWNSFFDYWCSNYSDSDERPEYVWGTAEIPMELDANSVIDQACEGLYEEAECVISDVARKEMQDYFTKWLDEYGLTAYVYDDKHAIRIPWEDSSYD